MKSKKPPALAEKILETLVNNPHSLYSKAELGVLLNTSENTIKTHLNKSFLLRPEIIDQLTDFIPSATNLIQVSKIKFGKSIDESNIMEFNEICKDWLFRCSSRVHLNYLKNTLKQHTKASQVHLSLTDLNTFLLEDYQEYTKSINNSIVSITGQTTEAMIADGLNCIGMKDKIDFLKRGHGTEGDIIIVNQKPNSKVGNLYVEIKSFYAKERFSVALNSIKHPLKIGIGFFVDPSEFNKSSTDKYREINPLAIYMPDKTYKLVDDECKRKLAQNDSSLYRPLSRFFSDMKFFRQNAKLPDYKF